MKITRPDAFQVCPEWVLLADISAQAVRLYLVLSKASDNETKTHRWGRKKLAEAMRVKSPRSVDKYLAELEAIGAVAIRTQFQDGRQTTNEYRVITADPSQYSARGVAGNCTPGVAGNCTPGVAENCSQSYNLYELRTSKDLGGAADADAPTTAITETEEPHPAQDTAPRPPKPRFAYPDAFETFWSTYPLRKEKRKAYEAWAKATTEVGEDTVLQGAKAYAHDSKRLSEPRFTKHPTTWLNQGCWDDDYTETRKEKEWNPWN